MNRKETNQAAVGVEVNAGKVKSRRKHPHLEIIGMEFTWLTVLSGAGKIKKGYPYKYLCRCRCGKELKVGWQALSNGDSTSCGCRKQQMTGARFLKHGQCVDFGKSKTYQCFHAMIHRCENPNAKHFNHYGGRGIEICSLLRTFDGFLSVLGEKPPGMTIERIDVNGNYSCGSCDQCKLEGWVKNVKWATMKEQSNNKRSSIRITYNGETLTMQQWCQRAGLAFNTLHNRIFGMKWDLEKALNTPPKKSGRWPTKRVRQFVGVPFQIQAGRTFLNHEAPPA